MLRQAISLIEPRPNPYIKHLRLPLRSIHSILKPTFFDPLSFLAMALDPYNAPASTPKMRVAPSAPLVISLPAPTNTPAVATSTTVQVPPATTTAKGKPRCSDKGPVGPKDWPARYLTKAVAANAPKGSNTRETRVHMLRRFEKLGEERLLAQANKVTRVLPQRSVAHHISPPPIKRPAGHYE